jgi:hypothetical protein
MQLPLIAGIVAVDDAPPSSTRDRTQPAVVTVTLYGPVPFTVNPRYGGGGLLAGVREGASQRNDRGVAAQEVGA